MVYMGYRGTNKIEHDLAACTVDDPLAKARGYLSIHAKKPSSISHITLYQCHSVESTLIQSCLNIVCPLEMFPIKI